MASPTSPGPEGGACTQQNPPRIRQVGTGYRGCATHVLASPTFPKDWDIDSGDRGWPHWGPIHVNLGTSPSPGVFLKPLFHGPLCTHAPLTPPLYARAFLSQACNFCPYTLGHTRKLISLRSTEAHTQLSHDPLQSYTVRSHLGC